MNEYVGCKRERNKKERWIRFTQPVLLQSYTDEFSIPADVAPKIPRSDPGAMQERRRSQSEDTGDEQVVAYDAMVET
jgi:hypothetical protein